jgi:hypothetical protein
MATTSLVPLIAAVLWDITQCVVSISYRRFGTTYQSHLQGSRMEEEKSLCVRAQKSAIFIYFAVGT